MKWFRKSSRKSKTFEILAPENGCINENIHWLLKNERQPNKNRKKRAELFEEWNGIAICSETKLVKKKFCRKTNDSHTFNEIGGMLGNFMKKWILIQLSAKITVRFSE